MQPSHYQDIGQYLKESRESLRVSLEDAGAALHIRVKYLRALESGDLKDMPGKAYIRGYIRNYAYYLGLDAGQVLDGYAGALGPRAQELFIPEPTQQQNAPGRWIIWLCLAALFVVYGCWYRYFHDASALKILVAELPASFAHLLDKAPPAMMDKAWEGCLTGDDAGCYVAVRARQLPPHSVYYDIHQLGAASAE